MKSQDHPFQESMSPRDLEEQAKIAQAEMRAIQNIQQKISSYLNDTELRKWCIEQANTFCQYNEATSSGRQFALDDVAEVILKFVSAPLHEIMKNGNAKAD